MVTWFAGLFYLPRLFVYHAMSNDAISQERFKLMERKLYSFTTPSAIMTVLLGLWLWLGYGFSGAWLYVKLGLVAALVAYHIYCGKLMRDFQRGQNVRSARYFRWFNEIPAVILIAVVLLVVLKPFK